MDEGQLPTEQMLRATQVGDTLRMMIEKASVRAEVRDRVSPVLPEGTAPGGNAAIEGFVKDASGEWDLDSMTGAKAAVVVEIIVRRIASNI
jgi:hypothetical protein